MRKGFTLIELLVVVALIGILATLIMANFSEARARSRDAQRKSDLNQIATALRLYYNDNGSYPVSLPWGDQWDNGSSTIYMNLLRNDPLYDSATGTPSYSYLLGSDIDSSDTDSFRLSACLENKSDPSGKSITISGWSCTSGVVFQIKP